MSQRRTLTVGDVAARLEHRLYMYEQTARSLQEQCRFARDAGLSAVITYPDTLPTVAGQLAGTTMRVVTVPGWHHGEVEPLAGEALRTEACRLTAQGATDLAVLATADRLLADGGRWFAGEVRALVQTMDGKGARVRVVLETDALSTAETATVCELLGSTGAWLVQGGSWRDGARTGFSRLQTMRRALPDRVRLKWTFPVRSLDLLMICIAEGIDLCNGDPESLLGAAARRLEVCPLLVPVRGRDY